MWPFWCIMIKNLLKITQEKNWFNWFPKMGVMGATWYIFNFPKGIFPNCNFPNCIFPNCIFTICIFSNCIFWCVPGVREISQIWMGLVQETMSHLEMFIFTQTGNIALVTINTCGGPNICSHYCSMGAHTWYTTPADLICPHFCIIQLSRSAFQKFCEASE